MRKDCEHIVCLAEFFGQDCNLYSEESLKEYFLDIIECDYKNELNKIKTIGEFDFAFNSKTNDFTKEIFGIRICFLDYCCDCGEKLNKNKIKNNINKVVKEKVIEIEKNMTKEIINRMTQRENSKKRKKENKKTKDGYVYLVKLDKYFKIGITQNPKSRLKEFTLLPHKLEHIISVYTNDCEKIEKDLHDKYKYFRVRGEWFEFNNDQVEEIIYYLNNTNIYK